MKKYSDMTKEELLTLKAQLEKEFADIKAQGLTLDMSRGKPSAAQLDLSMEMMSVLNSDSNRFANAMKASNVKKSDVVFVQLFNSPQFLFGYIASQKIGAIFNAANFNLSPGETAEIIDHNKPKIYVQTYE